MMIESWFENYAESIYKYILFMVKDHQIAEDLTQLEWSEGKVKMTLSRALKTLQHILNEHGGIGNEQFTR